MFNEMVFAQKKCLTEWFLELVGGGSYDFDFFYYTRKRLMISSSLHTFVISSIYRLFNLLDRIYVCLFLIWTKPYKVSDIYGVDLMMISYK